MTPATAGWTWAQTTAVIVAVIGLFGAVVIWALNQHAVRRERRSAAFAAALTAVERYAELPYRIRRRPDTAEARHELAAAVSDVQAELAFHQAWLELEAATVARVYRQFVAATRHQAGTQMSTAWLEPVIRDDAGMNLHVAYPRDEIDDARQKCISAMSKALRARGKR
jgi:hypothetical protein